MSEEKLPSFLESLFFREIHAQCLKPFPTLDSETQEECDMFYETQQKFLDDKVDAVKIDQEARIPMELINEYGEQGFFGITIPEDYDGSGVPYTTYCKLIEGLTRHEPSFATVMGGHQSLAIKPLLLASSDEQKQEWLPRLASGELLGAFALTESSAGSDVNNLKSIAEPTEDGEHYIINGEKIWITNGAYANFFVYFARVPIEKDGVKKFKIACFILTRDMEGLSTGEPEKKLGLKGSSTTTVVCQNVKVPKANLVGTVDDGFMLAMQTLNYGRLSLSAGCVGVMKKMLLHAREFAEQRITFGRPIIEHGMVARMLAEMEIDLFVGESMAYLTAGNVDRGQAEFQLESAASKTFCSEAAWRVINNAIQIAGGTGYMSEYPYERYLRDGRINSIFEGTNEIQRMFISLYALKKLGKAIQDGGVVKAIGKLIGEKLSTPSLDGMRPELEDSVERFREMVDILSINARKAVTQWQKKIVEVQLVQQRIADIAIYTFAASAAIARADHYLEKDDSFAARAVKLTDYFTFDALKKVKIWADEIWDNRDEDLLSLAKCDM